MRVQTKRLDNATAYLMLSPVVILLTIFVVIPFFYSIYISFFEWGFYQDPKFVGFRNFYLVFMDDNFYKSLWVGLKFALLVVPIKMVLAFLFAHVIVHMGKKAAGFIKTSIYIPTVISGIIASAIFGIIYNYDGGFANYIIGLFGYEKIAWLGDVRTALASLVVPAVWLAFGVSALIMLAGLLDVPQSYYEAAEIEGASALNKMIHITIPLMKNVILFVLITGLVAAIQQVELPLFLTNGGPNGETLLPNLYIFNHFRNDILMGHTIASALLLFIMLGAISVIIFKVLNSEKAIDE
jgi:multiple sugar transport system permease protein